MKSYKILCVLFLLNAGYAHGVDKISPIIVEPIEIKAIEAEQECPQGSKYAGETLPDWVSGKESIEFYCNASEEESEIAE